jgi:hypothetical protein
MLVLTMLALFTLIQFPFSSPIYFCYVAPLLLLAAAAVGELLGAFVKGSGAVLAAFAVAFPILRIAPGFIYNMGIRFEADEQSTKLDVARAGEIRITKAEAAEYSSLVDLVANHSAVGSTILALPDSPEVYFLTQRRNPSRVFFDFLAPTYPDQEQAIETIRSQRVSLLVLNMRPAFSHVPGQEVLRAASRAYPHAATAGRFTVRWK